MSQLTLAELGWSAHFLSQLHLDELEKLTPLRVSEVQRNRATGLGPAGDQTLLFPPDIAAGDVAVGDWVLIDPQTGRIERVLERRSTLVRRSAGETGAAQLIAANVDTLFIVTSWNADFNVARLERYVALALEAGCTPVIVLTKADLDDDPGAYAAKAWAISPEIIDVIPLNALDTSGLDPLRRWCGKGQTVAFAGSSGVGKSTLISGLTGLALTTQGIREDDAKGRHTTTSRSLHLLPDGGLVIDLPGMRELGLVEAADGIDTLFADITDLAVQCRFRNCAHDTEPGCAIQAAIDKGVLDPDRLKRWQKLRREDARNSETLAEARARHRAFGKVIKSLNKPIY